MKHLFLALGLVFGVCASSSHADGLKTDDPEIFKLRIEPNVSRCLEDWRGIDHCKKADGLDIQTQTALSDCTGDNAFGKNCSGNYTKTVAIGNVKYLLRVDITHFVNPDFKYMISVWVCRNADYSQCGRSTLYLKDTNVPGYTVSGPILDKGKYGHYNLWYGGTIILGELPDMNKTAPQP